MYAKKIFKNYVSLYSFIEVYHFFIQVKQNLPNDCIEKEPVFIHLHRDIYLSIIIHTKGDSKLKFIRERAGRIDSDRGRFM